MLDSIVSGGGAGSSLIFSRFHLFRRIDQADGAAGPVGGGTGRLIRWSKTLQSLGQR